MSKKNEDKLFEEFQDLIREKITDRQFMVYAEAWFNEEEMAERMESYFLNLDEEEKKKELGELKFIMDNN